MVSHVSIIHGLGCLTSVIWPFTLTAFTFECLYSANVSHFKDGWAVNFVLCVKLVVIEFPIGSNLHKTSMTQKLRQWRWMVRSLKLCNQEHRQYWDGWPFEIYIFSSVLLILLNSLNQSKEIIQKPGYLCVLTSITRLLELFSFLTYESSSMGACWFSDIFFRSVNDWANENSSAKAMTTKQSGKW